MEASTHHQPKEDTMSVITAAHPAASHQSSSTLSSTGRQGWFASVRRELQRRRYHRARRAHERQDLTDAYIDRHGTAEFDTATAAALMQR
jgi:predicted alpha/beta-hydrolase family hydrolase